MPQDRNPSSHLLCFIKRGLGCGQEVQQYQIESHAADSADEKKGHHVSLERIGLSGPHPGKHGLCCIHEPCDACASTRSKIKNRGIQETKDEVAHTDQAAGWLHLQKSDSYVNMQRAGSQHEYNRLPATQGSEKQGDGRMQEKVEGDKDANGQEKPGDDGDAERTRCALWDRNRRSGKRNSAGAVPE